MIVNKVIFGRYLVLVFNCYGCGFGGNSFSCIRIWGSRNYYGEKRLLFMGVCISWISFLSCFGKEFNFCGGS